MSESNGVSFWENEIVLDKNSIEEDFGISPNRTMDIESFNDIMVENGHNIQNDTYTIIRDEKLIELLKNEFRYDN